MTKKGRRAVKVPVSLNLTVNSNVIIHFFDVDASTITRWVNAGMPKLERNTFDLHACFLWWMENINKDPDATPGEAGARERYWAAKADNEEIRRDNSRRELISRSEIEPSWAERSALYRIGIEALEHRLPPRLEGRDQAEMRGIIAECGREILVSVFREGEFTPQSVTGSAPAKKRGRPRKQ